MRNACRADRELVVRARFGESSRGSRRACDHVGARDPSRRRLRADRQTGCGRPAPHGVARRSEHLHGRWTRDRPPHRSADASVFTLRLPSRSRAGGERRSSRSSGASSPWGSSRSRRIEHHSTSDPACWQPSPASWQVWSLPSTSETVWRGRWEPWKSSPTSHVPSCVRADLEEALAIAASALSRDVRAPVAIWWSPDDGVRALASLSGVNAAKTDVVVRDLGEVAPSDQMSDGERAELRQRFARVLGVVARRSVKRLVHSCSWRVAAPSRSIGST